MKKKRIVYFGLLIIIFLTSTMCFSYAFFTNKTEGSGKLNIVAGTLNYKIESEDLVDNMVTIEANSMKKVTLNVNSLNEISSKYGLYYQVDDIDGLVIGYGDKNNQMSGVIEANANQKIDVFIRNTSSDSKILTFNVGGSLLNDEIDFGDNKNLFENLCVDNMVYAFNYIGDSQNFVSPCSGNYQVELWGAAGGSAYYTFATNEDGSRVEAGDLVTGGYGGYTLGNINLSNSTNFYVYVGGKGVDGKASVVSAGGYNGGGNGGAAYQGAGAGGGATDIRLVGGNWNDFDSLKSRIMVAGAASGTSNASNAVSGGAGGGLKGYDGNLNVNNVNHTLATGGTQFLGGTAGGYEEDNYHGYPGEFGMGGDAQRYHGGGGGSGYYGGGGAGFISAGVSSGAGGSSFISGHNGCDAVSEESLEDNIIHTGQSVHYSGYSFTNTVMIDGNGYNWTTEKGEYVGMPTFDNTSTMIGNSGNGYAKIIYLGD